jgi:hypothetical protein
MVNPVSIKDYIHFKKGHQKWLFELGDYNPNFLSQENTAESEDFVEYTALIGGNLYSFNFIKYEDAPYNVFGRVDDDLLDYDEPPEGVREIWEKYLPKDKYFSSDEIIVYNSFFHLVKDDGSRSVELEGTGTAATTISSAKESYRQFFRDIHYNFDVIFFTAREPSRKRVYDIEIARMMKEIGTPRKWVTKSVERSLTDKIYYVFNIPHLQGQEFEPEDERQTTFDF